MRVRVRVRVMIVVRVRAMVRIRVGSAVSGNGPLAEGEGVDAPAARVLEADLEVRGTGLDGHEAPARALLNNAHGGGGGG